MLKKLRNAVSNPLYTFSYILHKGNNKKISDEVYLKYKYNCELGKRLDLKNPTTFNEKLQWLKINDRNEKYRKLVDKYEVRKYISEKIGEEYLIPLLGVWNSFEEIDFSLLPNKFVLKCTHDSGSVIICEDKDKFNINEAKKQINKFLSEDYYYASREWPYKNVKRQIVCEEYISDSTSHDLKDYKFMCFNGEPKIIQVMGNRKGDSYLINHFDLNWNEVFFERKTVKRNSNPPEKPINLEEMIYISKKLSHNIPLARIDLYETDQQIYFGEITFFPVSGFMDFANYNDDKLWGSWLDLSKI